MRRITPGPLKILFQNLCFGFSGVVISSLHRTSAFRVSELARNTLRGLVRSDFFPVFVHDAATGSTVPATPQQFLSILRPAKRWRSCTTFRTRHRRPSDPPFSIFGQPIANHCTDRAPNYDRNQYEKCLHHFILHDRTLRLWRGLPVATNRWFALNW